MNNTIVRINSIELENFKNVNYGLIELPSKIDKTYFDYTADILGIYGQNGSGKTAVIEAMEIIHTLWRGKSLKKETSNYINKNKNSCTITIQLSIDEGKNKYLSFYTVELTKTTNGKVNITKESLDYSKNNKGNFETKKKLLEFTYHEDELNLKPKYRVEELLKSNPKNMTKLEVAKTLSQRNSCSFFFGEDGKEIFINALNNLNDEYTIFKQIFNYANENLFVISKAQTIINDLLTFTYKINKEEKETKGNIKINLKSPDVITKEDYSILKQILKQMNTILNKVIPDLTIGIHEFGDELLTNNTTGKRIELISIKKDLQIPLKYESEGIIKIISILNVLMSIYNEPSMCLIIDELDAGIFEYLLGELVSIFEEGAKGQLIFTSHNLRILEKVDKKSIMFSTINPQNRYIHFKNVKKNHNLRDTYIRCILLGGQKEGICEETDSVEIGRAFRKIRRNKND